MVSERIFEHRIDLNGLHNAECHFPRVSHRLLFSQQAVRFARRLLPVETGTQIHAGSWALAWVFPHSAPVISTMSWRPA